MNDLTVTLIAVGFLLWSCVGEAGDYVWMEPCKNAEKMKKALGWEMAGLWVRREYIKVVSEDEAGESNCTHILMASGTQLLVKGTAEEIKRRLEK